MGVRRIDPLRLDVAALARDGATLSGEWPMGDLARLQQSQSPPQDWMPPPVVWSVRGERRAVAGGAPETWLHLQAQVPVWLTCQRCLLPYRIELTADRPVRFVPGEERAEALDAEIDEDVLALTPALNLRTLVEDELLLALPIVPRHEVCPAQSAVTDSTTLSDEPHANPFAALALLKSRPPRR
jgi:uncharacterized protein